MSAIGTLLVNTENPSIIYQNILYERKVVNDKRNEFREVYVDGKLAHKMQCKIKNNREVCDGWGCSYHDNKEYWFRFVNGKRKNQIESPDENGYRKEVNILTREIVSICRYDDNHEYTDEGYLFTNGLVSKHGIFKDGQCIKTLATFSHIIDRSGVQTDLKTEWEDFNSGKKLYEGCYEDSFQKHYPRIGKGDEYINGTLVYYGGWKDNQRDGNGTELENGVPKYSGEWKNGQYEGQGKLYCSGSLIYDGEWKNNKRNGEGTECSQSKVVYRGHWENGKREGKGKLYDDNGNVSYEGDWHGNNRHGHGVEKKEDDTVFEGVWSDDKKVSGKVFENGQLIYEGSLLNDLYDGAGKEYKDNKVIREGYYKKGNLISSNPPSPKKNRRFVWILVSLVVVLVVLLGALLGLSNSHSDEVTILRSYKDYLSLKTDVKYLQIPSDSCNDDEFTEFTLSSFSLLKWIEIGDNSLVNVRHVSIQNMPQLTRLIIGAHSFSPSLSMFGIESNGGSFVLKNCNMLEEVRIDILSFAAYQSCSLSNLPSLQSLIIGDYQQHSNCFYNAPLQLKDLPQLQTLVVGYDSFHNNSNSNLNNLPSLKQLQVGRSDFSCSIYAFSQRNGLRFADHSYQVHSKASSLTIEPNSCNEEGLTELRFDGYNGMKNLNIGENSFTHVKTVDISAFDQLETIVIGKNGFTESPNNYGETLDKKEFHVTNCSSLTSLVVDRFAFSEYSVFDVRGMIIL